jgi:hypothetical protein
VFTSLNIDLFVLPFHARISVNDDTVPQNNNSISPVGFPPEVSAAETLGNSGSMTADRFTAVLFHQIIPYCVSRNPILSRAV